MYTKEQLRKYLCEISENAEFPVFNFTNSDQYTILIKCHVDCDRNSDYYNEYITEWIKKFTKFTKCGWIVRAIFPKLKRLLFRKVFLCQYSGYNKKKTPHDLIQRNKLCKAKIEFKVKFINKDTIKNDIKLKDGLNLTISINFVHTHGIRDLELNHLLRCSAETDDTFMRYFSSGYGIAAAKSYHELTVIATSRKGLGNPSVSPSLNHLTYLLRKWKDSNPQMFDTMAERVKLVEHSGGVIRHTDDYSITVIITPFMKNVLSGHELDNVIVDSTPIKDGVASFFFVPTPVGVLPFACAFHAQSTEPSFSQAFFTTKLLLENQILKTFEPRKIANNMIDEQHHALDAIFSKKTLFVSRVSMIENIWRTICDGATKIRRKFRHGVMVLFNSLLHAASLEEAERFYTELEGNKHVQSSDKLKEYLNEVWNKRDDYITQDNVVDISIRVLKQFLLQKCHLYNSMIMVDVLINILDNHWCQILQAHLKNKLIMHTHTKFLLKNNSAAKILAELEVPSQEYRLDVKNKEGNTMSIRFRDDTLCCDCVRGKRGRLCEHLCAILHTITLTTHITDEKREFYSALAGEQVKLEPDSDYSNNDDSMDMEETRSEENGEPNECYYIVKEEIDKHNDPLDSSQSDEDIIHNTIESDAESNKRKYINTLRALNDEFRRLNTTFRNNPSTSNLDTMGRLTRELSKIRPVERFDVSNVFVEVNENGE